MHHDLFNCHRHRPNAEDCEGCGLIVLILFISIFALAGIGVGTYALLKDEPTMETTDE